MRANFRKNADPVEQKTRNAAAVILFAIRVYFVTNLLSQEGFARLILELAGKRVLPAVLEVSALMGLYVMKREYAGGVAGRLESPAVWGDIAMVAPHAVATCIVRLA
jgi:hypothetical protein